MRPVLFQMPDGLPLLGGAPIFTYGVLLGLAYVVAYGVAQGLLPLELRGRAAHIYIRAGVLGWVGARYLGPEVDGGTPLVGGTLWPGILCAGATAVLAARGLEATARWRVVDAAAVGAAFGIALGRVGCFLHGCDYGVPWNSVVSVTWPGWAGAFGEVVTAGAGTARLPVQLVEAAAALVLGASLLRMSASPGGRATRFFVAYAVLRIALEFLRGDVERGVSVWGTGLSVGQVTSCGVIAVFLGWSTTRVLVSRSGTR